MTGTPLALVTQMVRLTNAPSRKYENSKLILLFLNDFSRFV